MLNDWAQTKGLKRKTPKDIRGELDASLAKYVAMLPKGTNVSRHWSGKGSMQEAAKAVKALRGDLLYATFFRFTSSISHATDFGIHFTTDPKTGDLVWEIGPTVKGFETPSYAARQLFWNAANRIDERLGLGFASTLAPYKLVTADVEKGIK